VRGDTKSIGSRLQSARPASKVGSPVYGSPGRETKRTGFSPISPQLHHVEVPDFLVEP